jgi:GT2 family glycosyltransferase
MDCSIIIVNYKSATLLTECLRTLYVQTANISYEVIVVDNASGDDSKEIITKEFANVHWIQLDYNAGFARGNNAGIRASNGKTVLLLNADTLVPGNAIGNCCTSLLNSDYVAAGVQLLNPDGSPQISGNYAMIGGLNYLLPLPYLGKFVKFLGKIFGVRKPNVPDSNDIVEVDWINGAFLMVKRDVIEKAGLLDEDFFLYSEEAEWCSRIKKYGRLCIFGKEKVIHLQGETANATFGSSGKGYYNLYDKKGLQIMVSNFLRIRKEFGLGWFFLHLLIYVLEIFIFPVFLLIEYIIRLGKSRYTWGQCVKYAVNVIKLLALCPRIIVNKPYFYKVL